MVLSIYFYFLRQQTLLIKLAQFWPV